MRYSAGILKWTKDELKVMVMKTQKILLINRMYHPQSDADGLYIPRMEGEQGLLSIVDCVEAEEKNFISRSVIEKVLRLSKSERILPEYEGPVSTAKKQTEEERHKQWKGKQLHGKFVRETKEVISEEIWRWIQGCN